MGGGGAVTSMAAAWSLWLRAHDCTGKTRPWHRSAWNVTLSVWHVLSGMRGHAPPRWKCPASHSHEQLPPAAATAAAAAGEYGGPGEE